MKSGKPTDYLRGLLPPRFLWLILPYALAVTREVTIPLLVASLVSLMGVLYPITTGFPAM